jgi:multiple sugar transport system permease protein
MTSARQLPIPALEIPRDGAIAAPRVGRRRSRPSIASLVALIVLCIGALGAVLPFLWMFSTSLRPVSDSYLLPPAWLPTQWHFENYLKIFDQGIPIVRFALNSLLIAGLVTIGQLFTCSTAAYAFAHLEFRGKGLLFGALLASLMVPIQVTIIPIFILMSRIGLVDNPMSVVVMSLTSAFGVFLMRQFFMAIPRELIDAARIDGAGEWTIYRRVVLPLAKPALGALGTITFVTMWNSYLVPLIMLSKTENLTLPLGILSLRLPFGDAGSSVFMAAVALSVLPVLLIFLIGQRWIIETMTRAGVKG